MVGKWRDSRGKSRGESGGKMEGKCGIKRKGCLWHAVSGRVHGGHSMHAYMEGMLVHGMRRVCCRRYACTCSG